MSGQNRRVRRIRRGASSVVVALGALTLSACAAFGVSGGSDAAADFPSGNVEHVVPLPAGGGTDTVTQLLNAPLEEQLGVPVNVVIRDGGAGSTGVSHLLNKPADGHTIMTTPPDVMTTGPVGNPGRGYDPETDLQPVVTVTRDPWVMLASVDSGLTSWDDFLARAEEDPSSLTIGISSVMGSDHYGWLLIERALGFPGFNYVTYGGGGPYMRAVLGGEVDLVLHVEASIDEEFVTPLVVMSPEELENWPDVPTTDEVGIEEAHAYLWQGIVVHPDTPEEIVEALEQHITAAVESDAFQQAAGEAGFHAFALSTEEFIEMAETERRLAREVIEAIDEANIQEAEGQ